MLNTYSQSSQDLFVSLIMKEKKNGYFLEIGSNDPLNNNNSFLLEKKYNVSNKTPINQTTNFSTLFIAKKTQFMLPERSAKYLEQINELETNDLRSPLRKIGRALDVRLKIFKYTWNYLLSTY